MFEMTGPEKYSGEKDNDRKYDAVQLFLSQLSRYFRLATNIDTDWEIVTYTAAISLMCLHPPSLIILIKRKRYAIRLEEFRGGRCAKT